MPSIHGWRKSTRSGAQANCVEVVRSIDGRFIGVRDSKDQDGNVLIFSHRSWAAFITAVMADDFHS